VRFVDDDQATFQIFLNPLCCDSARRSTSCEIVYEIAAESRIGLEFVEIVDDAIRGAIEFVTSVWI